MGVRFSGVGLSSFCLVSSARIAVVRLLAFADILFAF